MSYCIRPHTIIELFRVITKRANVGWLRMVDHLLVVLSLIHAHATLKWQIAEAAVAMAAATAAAAVASGFSVRRRRHGKNKSAFVQKIWKGQNHEKPRKDWWKSAKPRFWRSCTKTDVTIKFYTKNSPCRLLVKPVRLKIAKNRFLASSHRPWQNNNVKKIS